MSESTIVATILRHRSVRESWAAVTLDVSEGCAGLPAGSTVSASGALLANAAAGEKLELHGELDHHPHWGRQFRVSGWSSLGITTVIDAARWLERLDGVGPKKALAIHSHFLRLGRDILTVLRETQEGEDPLVDVDGIGPRLASVIRDSWDHVGSQCDPETLQFLDGIGCSRWEATNILEHAGELGMTAVELLETSPYSLTDRKGLGFLRVDRIALRAGIDRHSPARVQAAVTYQLDQLIRATGSTYAGMRDLLAGSQRFGQAGVCEMIGVQAPLVLAAIDRLEAAGSLVVAQSESGRRVHPLDLLRAERDVYRLLHLQQREESPSAWPGGVETGNPAGFFCSPADGPQEFPCALTTGGDTPPVVPSRDAKVRELLSQLGPETEADW